MSKNNAKKLVDKLSKNKKFRDALLAEEEKAALRFAKKAGLECTAEELKAVYGANQIDWASINKELARYGVPLNDSNKAAMAEGAKNILTGMGHADIAKNLH